MDTEYEDREPQAVTVAGSWPSGSLRFHFFLPPWLQVKLKQIIPRTEEEKTEHGVAAERRRMRLVYAETIQDLLASFPIKDGE